MAGVRKERLEQLADVHEPAALARDLTALGTAGRTRSLGSASAWRILPGRPRGCAMTGR